MSIAYKMFTPDGEPLRAVITVTFKSSIDDQTRVAVEDHRWADLTHDRAVQPGDTLPLLCFQIYGDPRQYLMVAGSTGSTTSAA